MTDDRWNRIKSLFIEASTCDGDERVALLAHECAGDPDLRREVESLLDARDSAIVETGGGARAAAAVDPAADLVQGFAFEEPGAQIGPYQLRERIGEGGFGCVYMAEQCEPVRRRVALKIIKAGMDTRQVIARFGAERQALALMDHPNIARVLDA